MAIYDKKIEAMIKQQIAKEVSQVKVPPLDEQWAKFQADLATRKIKKKPLILRYKWLAAALLLVIIGSFSLLKPAQVDAFGERIIEYFNQLVGKTTVNKVINETSTDAPVVGPKIGGTSVYGTQSFSSLEDLQSSVDYKIYVPDYLPDGVVFKNGSSENNDTNSVAINYGIGGDSLILTQEKFPSDNSNSILYDMEDSEVKEININSNPAFAKMAKSGRIEISWKIGSIKIKLSGLLPFEEMTKIAESVK